MIFIVETVFTAPLNRKNQYRDMNTHVEQPISEQKLNEAMKKIIDEFRKVDPRWICGEHDRLGMYRFLTGSNSHSMEQAMPNVKHEIHLIKTFVGNEFQRKVA